MATLTEAFCSPLGRHAHVGHLAFPGPLLRPAIRTAQPYRVLLHARAVDDQGDRFIGGFSPPLTDGKRRMSGGRRSTCGTPQGGVFSPTLANVYMNRFLKYWRRSERSSAYQAHVVSYADDFVILSRGHAEEALAWTGQAMARLGLTLNEAKTSIRDARRERFDFLGYAFGPHHYRKDGHWYLGASPSKKSVRRLKQKVGEILVPGNQAPWPEVRDRDGGPYTPQSIANAEYPHIPPGVVLPLRVPGNALWNAVARSSRHILSA